MHIYICSTDVCEWMETLHIYAPHSIWQSYYASHLGRCFHQLLWFYWCEQKYSQMLPSFSNPFVSQTVLINIMLYLFQNWRRSYTFRDQPKLTDVGRSFTSLLPVPSEISHPVIQPVSQSTHCTGQQCHMYFLIIFFWHSQGTTV